jgi:large repetitive protein
MMRLFILFTFCLTLFASQLIAQEICNNNLDDDGDGLVDCLDGECGSKVCEICDNGIDDDGDYFIDCYDKECNLSADAACNGFFLGKGADCDARPESFSPFSMKLKFLSNPGLTNHVSRIVAGDINNDGMPELVTTYSNLTGSTVTASKINVFAAPAAGTTLALTTSINVNMIAGEGVSYEDIAMADINGDGCAEIFVVTKNLSTNANFKIVAYDCNQTQVWASPASLAFDPGLIGLADFDGDGRVELYSRTQIFDAHTGTLLGANNIDDATAGIHSGVNKGWGMNSNAPIAVDILPSNPGLELVAGCRIYGVNINRGAMTATLTMLKEYQQYATRTGRIESNPTSVADFNQDGFLDVLAVGSDGAYDDNTTIFFWDVQNNAIKKYIDLSGTGSYLKGWRYGAGRINIADIDGDKLMDAVYVSGKYMYALKEGNTNLELSRRVNVTDETSGFTAVTTFDFNGDGRAEIVYRDENFLFVYHSDADGVLILNSQVRCSSRSHQEYPIVVDMDGDGSSEICVTCSTTTTANGTALTFWDAAEVRVYESANEPWVPARKVWNQHGYLNVNVNDDLTIPREQQLHHLAYADNAGDGAVRPFNSFLNQTTYLNSNGLLSYPAVNVALVPASPTTSIDYKPFDCLADSVQVTFKYTNRGDISANGTLNISFYNGDPRLAVPLATRFATKSVLLSGLNPDDIITTTTNLKSPHAAFDLFIVVNDNGTTIPLDITLQSGHIIECDYDNVISAHIILDAVALIPELIKDNLKCLNVPGVPITPDNGAVKAYVSMGGVKDSTNFNFYWSIGPNAKPIASVDYIGSTYTGLGSGAYTVSAAHKTISCGSNTATLVVNEISAHVDARVVLEKEFDDLDNPNGELRAVVNDANYDGIGDPKDNFNYAWYSGQNILVGNTLGTSHTLTGLGAGTYSVLVSDKVNGCYDTAYATMHLKENVLGNEEEARITGVSMYPNPGTNSLTIFIDNAYIGDVQLQLQSALGNEVDKTFLNHKSTRTLTLPVETTTLKPGVYLVKISLGKGFLYKKWIKL